MATIRICTDCEQLLKKASTAMRRHSLRMNTAMALVHTGLTKQQKDEYTTKLIETFFVAQSAWEAYRAHLRGHGILPVIPPATHV
jgi:hypothetical protein